MLESFSGRALYFVRCEYIRFIHSLNQFTFYSFMQIGGSGLAGKVQATDASKSCESIPGTAMDLLRPAVAASHLRGRFS